MPKINDIHQRTIDDAQLLPNETHERLLRVINDRITASRADYRTRLLSILPEAEVNDLLDARGQRTAGWTDMNEINDYIIGKAAQKTIALEQLLDPRIDRRNRLTLNGTRLTHRVQNPTSSIGMRCIQAMNAFGRMHTGGVNLQQVGDVITTPQQVSRLQGIQAMNSSLKSFNIDEALSLGQPAVIDLTISPYSFSTVPTGKYVIPYQQLLVLSNQLMFGYPPGTPLTSEQNKIVVEAMKKLQKEIDELNLKASNFERQKQSIRNAAAMISYTVPLTTFDSVTDYNAFIAHLDAYDVNVDGTNISMHDWNNVPANKSRMLRLNERIANARGTNYGNQVKADQLLREVITLDLFGEYREFNSTEKKIIDDLVAIATRAPRTATTEDATRYRVQREAVERKVLAEQQAIATSNAERIARRPGWFRRMFPNGITFRI